MGAGSDFNTKSSRQVTATAEEGKSETFPAVLILLLIRVFSHNIDAAHVAWSGSFTTVLKGEEVTIQDQEKMFFSYGIPIISKYS